MVMVEPRGTGLGLIKLRAAELSKSLSSESVTERGRRYPLWLDNIPLGGRGTQPNATTVVKQRPYPSRTGVGFGAIALKKYGVAGGSFG